MLRSEMRIRPEFFYQLIYGKIFSDLGSGGGKNSKTSKVNQHSY